MLRLGPHTALHMHQPVEPDPLVVAFLDVGKGDAIVVLVPGESSAIVVDCPSGASETVLAYLADAHITIIKWVIITHSDQDHAGDVPKLIADFRTAYGGSVERLSYLNDRVIDPNPEKQAKHKHLLANMALRLRDGISADPDPYADRSMSFGGGLEVTILHPAKADLTDMLAVGGGINDTSVVMRLDYRGKSVLLTGDAQGRAWRWMRERGVNLKVDVLKFPHHGASFTTPVHVSDVLDLVDPRYVVISVGTRNIDGHPSAETLRLLRERRSLVRFVCTQATDRCHPAGVMSRAAEARDLVPRENRGRAYNRRTLACPCAGTVIIMFSSDILIEPTLDQHDRVINLFSHPGCRGATSA